ncbi:hypothetical protein EDD22DRAFT_844483 [Suillus occidentalis]|nr:hypothetical protein EDD22DRAFT_844483 [Suillus occidentalis]
MYKFNCVVLCDKLNNIFTVDIAPTQTVGDLKDLIKDKVKRQFNHVDAHCLELEQPHHVLSLVLEPFIMQFLEFIDMASRHHVVKPGSQATETHTCLSIAGVALSIMNASHVTCLGDSVSRRNALLKIETTIGSQGPYRPMVKFCDIDEDLLLAVTTGFKPDANDVIPPAESSITTGHINFRLISWCSTRLRVSLEVARREFNRVVEDHQPMLR